MKRVVIADTSPLNYLVLIGAIELLPKLFGEVWVSRTVWTELGSVGAPAVVIDWMKSTEKWVRFGPSVAAPVSLQKDLDAGERSAI